MDYASPKETAETYLKHLKIGVINRGKSIEDFNIAKVTLEDFSQQLEKLGWKLCKVV